MLDSLVYTTVREGAILHPVPQAGYVRLRGPDQMAFIQRQTTQDIHLLAPDRALISVLTTPTARILDVFLILSDETGSEPALGLVTLPGRGERTARYLKSRIFFMDKVTVEDSSPALAQLDLDGAQAGSALLQAGLEPPAQVEGRSIGQIAGFPVQVIRHPGLSGKGYRLLVPAEGLQPLIGALQSSGSLLIDDPAYAILRVEAGLPGPERELTEEYTPLEVNLEYAISSNKGCFTGQEVIARQTTYDKVTRKLVGLYLETLVEPGLQAQVDGTPAGTLTSCVLSPRFGPIGLAVIRRPYLKPGTVLSFHQGERLVKAHLTQLPFGPGS